MAKSDTYRFELTPAQWTNYLNKHQGAAEELVYAASKNQPEYRLGEQKGLWDRIKHNVMMNVSTPYRERFEASKTVQDFARNYNWRTTPEPMQQQPNVFQRPVVREVQPTQQPAVQPQVSRQVPVQVQSPAPEVEQAQARPTQKSLALGRGDDLSVRRVRSVDHDRFRSAIDERRHVQKKDRGQQRSR